jgi:hypothetical protein
VNQAFSVFLSTQRIFSGDVFADCVKKQAEERDDLFYFSILSFILVIAAIWIFAYKRSRIVDNTSSEGYFLGGRSLTGITIAGSILMTNLSTEQIVGQNGLHTAPPFWVKRQAPLNCAHGYHIETEIIGTKGSLRIGTVPEKNQVMIFNETGVVKQCVDGFLERFEQAYLSEAEEFIRCILEHRQPPVSVQDGVKPTLLGYACKKSFETASLVRMKSIAPAGK